MQNPFTKAYRYLRREYPDMSMMAVVGTAVGGGIAALAVAAAGGPLWAIPALAAVMGGGMVGMNALTFGEHNRPSDNTAVVNGFRIVGDKNDVASIAMTQKLIDGLTEKKKHLPELPAGLLKTIMKHVKDIEPRLARVRVYTQYGQQQFDTFSFSREMVNGKGQTVKQDVATAYVVKPETETPEAKAPVRVETPKIVLATAPVAPEFGALAKKVEAVEKRVEELENPAPAVLDKPKLHTPAA